MTGRFFKKLSEEPSMVVHAYNPSALETDVGRASIPKQTKEQTKKKLFEDSNIILTVSFLF
jgi:hypothetical protein